MTRLEDLDPSPAPHALLPGAHGSGARGSGLVTTRAETGHDVDHDRPARSERLCKGGRDLRRPLDPDATHAKAPCHRGEVGRSKADELLTPARAVAGDP